MKLSIDIAVFFFGSWFVRSEIEQRLWCDKFSSEVKAGQIGEYCSFVLFLRRLKGLRSSFIEIMVTLRTAINMNSRRNIKKDIVTEGRNSWVRKTQWMYHHTKHHHNSQLQVNYTIVKIHLKRRNGILNDIITK